jgi:hypothetical protein
MSEDDTDDDDEKEEDMNKDDIEDLEYTYTCTYLCAC